MEFSIDNINNTNEKVRKKQPDWIKTIIDIGKSSRPRSQSPVRNHIASRMKDKIYHIKNSFKH